MRRATARSSNPDSPAMAATAVCVAVPAWQVQLAYSSTERCRTTLLSLGKAAASLALHLSSICRKIGAARHKARLISSSSVRVEKCMAACQR